MKKIVHEVVGEIVNLRFREDTPRFIRFILSTII